MSARSAPAKGRGATYNPANRFRSEQREAVDDGWNAAAVTEDVEGGEPPLKTVVRIQSARTIEKKIQRLEKGSKAGDKDAKPVSFKKNVPSPQDWVLVFERVK